MVQNSSHFRSTALLLVFLIGLQLIGWGCSESGNDKSSISSGTTTGGGGGSSGLPPAVITVSAGSRQLAGGGFTTTLTVIVTDSRGARTDATFFLTSSLGGNFIVSGDQKGGTINGTTTNGIFITTFESGVVLGETEIAASIPGTPLRGTTLIEIV
ncbi:MAG: hypothetical protein HY892_11550 [Deltaproteobacteria bacterium]|nr:hypothetical protein [Deltaproteobacteria bacterium]